MRRENNVGGKTSDEMEAKILTSPSFYSVSFAEIMPSPLQLSFAEADNTTSNSPSRHLKASIETQGGGGSARNTPVDGHLQHPFFLFRFIRGLPRSLVAGTGVAPVLRAFLAAS